VGASAFMWLHQALSGCIALAVGASFLSWVHHPINACIGLFVGVLVLLWVCWSSRGCIGLGLGALVPAWVHCSCHGCNGLVNRVYPSRVAILLFSSVLAVLSIWLFVFNCLIFSDVMCQVLLLQTDKNIFCVLFLSSNMEEDTEILAHKNNIKEGNDVNAESSTAPVRPECNVSDTYIEMILLHLCHC
jgi:hypothetical protein